MAEAKSVRAARRKAANEAARKAQAALATGDTRRGGLGGAARDNAAGRTSTPTPTAGEEKIAEKIFGGGLHPKFGVKPVGTYTIKKKKKP